MTRRFIGVRWWLGVAFAVVAATSTAIVVSQFSDHSEHAFRHHGENAALADAKKAATKHVTPASLSRVAKQLNGNVQLRLVGPASAGSGATSLERTAAQAAFAGKERK